MSFGSSSNLIGRRYLLGELLGQGGMGAVYRAADRLTGQQVALKRVVSAEENVDFSSSYNLGDFRLALAQEFKLLASLRHPHIIEVLDYGFDDERHPYFTMELLENSRTILETAEGSAQYLRLRLIGQMLQALAYLHRRGILHRDLKPANVLVVNGEVKLLDFGLSVMRDRTTDDGIVTAGTLAYMSPEVLMGNPATESSDLYSVGMIAYEMLADRYPFDLLDVGALVNHVLFTIPDVTTIDITPTLASVVHQLLQKEPDDRFSTAQEVLLALNAALDTPIPLETSATRDSFLQAARLVGRESEIHALSTALDQAAQRRGSVWLIAGESGVGKSRLVDEIRTLAMVNGALVVRGQGVGEGGLPYQVWRMVFRWLTLLTELDDADAALIKQIVPDAVSLMDRQGTAATETDPQKVQGRLFRLLESVLKAQQQPVVIILEDLHWATSESVVLLQQLSQIASSLPLLLIGSYRDDERADLPRLLPDVKLLKLNRLSEEKIAELSQAMLGEAGLQPEIIHLLNRETEGNVFFVIEVVRALAEEAGNLEQIGKSTLPEHVFAGGMQLIIQRRLNRIPEYSQEPLEIAAVIGRQIDLGLMRAITPGLDTTRWLLDCANAAVLEVREGDWFFAHDKLRNGVLAKLSEAERIATHRRVAEVIETVYDRAERAATLAHHWGMAGDTVREEQYVVLAGEQALRSGAYQEAVSFLERGLALINRERSADAEMQKRRVYLQHKQAEAYLGFGRYEQAQALYHDSFHLAQQTADKRGMAESLAGLGDVAYVLGDYERARQHYQQGMAAYRVLEDQSGVARMLNKLGDIAYDLGDHEEAKRLYQQSLTLAREIGDQWGMAGSLSKTDAAPEYENIIKTQELLAVNLETQLEADDKAGMVQTLYRMGEVAYSLKRNLDARRYFQRCLGIQREIEDVAGSVQTLNWLGAVNLSLDELEEASISYRQALIDALDHGLTTFALHTVLGLARLFIAEQKKAEALELLAFVLYAPGNDALEDEAERLVFVLEGEVSAESFEHAWERGKEGTLQAIARQLM